MTLTLYHARRTRSLRPLWLMEETVPQKVANYWEALKGRNAWKRAIEH